MEKLISKCPCCNEMLKITTLHCPACGMEMKNDFNLSAFDRLSNEQHAYLMVFLQQRGNLKKVQNQLGLSYPTAKKKLDELLIALELANEEDTHEKEEIDMRNLVVNHNSTDASEIIKAKLLACGGRVIVYTARGLPCEIWADVDGKSFVSDKLPIKPNYEYRVFDVIVDLLLANGGRARKGNGRNYKLGEHECDETTVAGTIAKKYAGKKNGESAFDPVFVFAAVLEWAGIAHNERGELVLTKSYRSMR